MSELRLFERLFRWDAWANARVVSALGALTNPPQKSIDRMAHLVCAQELWLSRLGAGEWEPGRALFPQGAKLAQVKRDAEIVSARWAQYLRVLAPDSLDEALTYTTTEGAQFTSRIEDILLQLTHHGAYHRGQIPLDLKHMNSPLPEGVSMVSDYIYYARTEPV